MLYSILEMLEMMVPVLMATAFFTLGESKFLGACQSSTGPKFVGLEYGSGLLQPFSDAFKLILKENMEPKKSNLFLYKFGPSISLFLSMFMWIMIPMKDNMSMSEDSLGVLLMLSMSSLAVYGIMYSGWASKSMYSLLGSLSAMAQLMSYEMSMGIMLMMMLFMSKSFNMLEIIYNQMYMWNMFPLLPISVLFWMSTLAETYSAPLDMSEAESELVAGTLVEYSSIFFIFLYLAEYLNILTLSTMTSIFFLGGTMTTIKTLFIALLFIWMSATVPSLRWDQLMFIGFSSILPFSIIYLLVCYTIYILFL